MSASILDAGVSTRRRFTDVIYPPSSERVHADASRLSTVLVLSSSTILCRGLESVLRASNSNFSVLQAESPAEAFILSESVSAQVLLIDALSFSRDSVPDLCRELSSSHPNARIVLLAPHNEKALIRESFAAGARCCICPDSDEFSIIVAFSSAEKGTQYLDPRITLGEEGEDATSPAFKLSTREREVHSLLSEGHSNRRISELLVISEATVKGHVSSILSKLGVRSRLAAALVPLAGTV